MVYPAIVYSREDIQSQFANNNPYSHRKRYQITVIDRDPDSEIPDKVSRLPLTNFIRGYVLDNLNHSRFSTYY